MAATDWTALLMQPKAILGAYAGNAPPLSTFAPHAWHAQFDELTIFGQFMRLPEKIPPSWGTAGNARADVVFRFIGIRLLRVDGVLNYSKEDDSLHGQPCGLPGACSLAATSDLHVNDVERDCFMLWKRFSFEQDAFSLLVEARHVSITCGRRASD